jgi:ectoine hydroxylase-related dioxygenase (phytanoyl-CoA dioxygenase family)
VLPGLIPGGLLEETWNAYERAVRTRAIHLEAEPAGEGDTLPGRYLNPHKRVRQFCRVAKYPKLLGSLHRLLGHRPRLLQTIASHKGSQQLAHSDSIHMTTYPLGYLAAAWVAFEDIGPDCGPLEFYPGSHRLPYVFSHHLGLSAGDLSNEGYKKYKSKYEPHIQELIAARGLKPAHFEARKGDVLIWHANLLHGGSRRRDLSLSRKAMVAHYFADGAFVYHDLSAVASRQQYFDGCLVK